MDPTTAGFFALEAAILGVGAALAALTVTGFRSLRREIAAVGTRLRGDLNAMEARLTERLRRVRITPRGPVAGPEARPGER